MRSIRARLLLTLVGGTLVALLLGGGGVYWLVRGSLLTQIDAALESRARAIAMLVTFENGHIEFESEDEDLTGASGDFMFSVRREDGALVKQAPPDPGDAFTPAKNAQPRADGDVASFDIELPGDRDGRALSLHFSPRAGEENEPNHESHTGPPLMVTVAATRDSVDRALAALVWALGIVGLAVVATVVSLLWIGVRSGLAPLDRLEKHLRNTDERSPKPFAPASNCPRELAPVYAELNRLLTRINSAMERERLFTDAASHELRTPLAELRAVVEVAERWPDSDRPIKALHEAGMIGEEMQRMVEALLVLSRARNGGATDKVDHIPVAPIVNRALSQLETAGSIHGLRVEATLDESATWPASPQAVELIVRNLLDNACSHTPEGGVVRVVLEKTEGEQTQLIVENSPVELSPDDIEHLTQPFWRKDIARSDRGHVGLGLSVVDRVATDMGLLIRPTLDEPARTLRICVEQRTAPERSLE